MYDFSNNPDEAGSASGPARALLMLELPRLVAELGASYTIDHLTPTRADGAGRPVLVIPGFGATDAMTARLRGHLAHAGFRVHGWGQGRNIGLTDVRIDGLVSRFDDLSSRYDQPVSIVGWSFGGLLARWMAHTEPDKVRQIVCLGSPWRAEGERTRATAAFERSRAKYGISDRAFDIVEQLRGPVPVPCTAIWSKSDGIVPWRGCVVDPSQDPIAENIEVISSHVGMAANPLVLKATTDRLSQSLNDWKPFRWRDAMSAPSAARQGADA